MLTAVGSVVEPELGRPISECDMVQGVVVRPGRVDVSLAVAVAGHPQGQRIRQDVASAVRALGVAEVVVDLTAMNDRDRSRLRRRLQGERTDPATVFGHTRIVAIASGKGGVGKSSIAANLAVAMARRGRRVALMDADVWGFSIPRMMGIDRGPIIIDGLLVPLEAHGVPRHVGRAADRGERAGHLARSDAAQDARAVRDGCVLGPAGGVGGRHASGHRRHLVEPGQAAAGRRGRHRDHPAAGRRSASPSAPPTWLAR